MTRAFAKANPAPQEAAGLRWLADGGARVPEILAEPPGSLVLQRIPAGRLDAAGQEELGRMLAGVHLAGAPRFGYTPGDGTFLVGRLPVEMPTADDAATHYALLCAPLLHGLGLDLPPIDVPAEPPARLHGDLWSGNVLGDDRGRPWLIDPAAYGGHRETDLAMLALFGVVPARTLAAYEEVHPLADGWRDRVRLWQLFPLLVHARLFGGSYLRQAADVARSLGR